MKRHRVHLACLIALLPLLPALPADGAWAQTITHTVTRSIEVTFPAVDFRRIPAEQAERINEILRERTIALVAQTARFGSVDCGYEVNLDQLGLLSVTLRCSGFEPGMAHPMHYRASVTVDVSTGKSYALSDLFSDPDYVPVLSQFVKREIEAQEIPLLTDFRGIAPDQDFYLTPDALVLYFQLYEIAPYAWGFVEVQVPYAALEQLAPAGGPIDRLAQRR